MKGLQKIIAFLAILFILVLSPHKISAKPETRELINNSLSLISTSNAVKISFEFKRILVDGVWWIYVYDSGKLIDMYPE